MPPPAADSALLVAARQLAEEAQERSRSGARQRRRPAPDPGPGTPAGHPGKRYEGEASAG